MKKRILPISVLICGLTSFHAFANSLDSVVPDPFQRFDADSKLTIDYRDLDSLLDTVVLNTGRSDRKKADPIRAQTGTRMKNKVNRATVNEGNRFYYEVFENNPDNQQTLHKIRTRLESIPSAVPLERFNRDEQLAYWLNLYNVTVLDEIVKVYPVADPVDLLVGPDSIFARKTLVLSGVPLSLNDIQFNILRQNYNGDPLVIYGLYQGVIGGPNIRKNAYTGKYVYNDLIENALEFVNSNRGTESKNSRVFRVSSFYQRNADYFPDFDKDLTAHLLTYLEGDERSELEKAGSIEPDIEDWTITDLYGTTRNLAGSLATNAAALDGAVVGNNSANAASRYASERYTPEMIQHLNDLAQKRAAQRSGTVTVEEMGEAPDETNATDQDDRGLD